VLTSFFIRFRNVLFLLAIVIGAAAFLFGPERKQNHSIDGMFAMDDELNESYQTLKRTFGGNEVILVVYRDSNLFEPEGQQRQRLICEKLNRVDGLDGDAMSIDSLCTLIRQYNIDQYRFAFTLAGFDISSSGVIDAAKTLFTGYTHSADGKTAAIVILLKSKEISDIPRSDIVANLREAIGAAVSQTQFESEVQLIGEPVMIADGFRMVQNDGKRLGVVATITLMAVVLICFRSLRWTLIPAAIVQYALLITEKWISTIGIEVTIVGSMSAAIITVIAVSTTIHLITRIRQNISAGQEYHAATESALRELSTPITIASLTDAFGFGALWFAELEPVQDFATVMVIGSLMVLLAFWLITPAIALFRGLDFLPFWNLRPSRTGLQSAFTKSLSVPLMIAERYPRLLLVLVAGIVMISVIGIQQNTIESDFTKNFRDNSKIVKSYRFVEENLGGAGVWDIMIPTTKQLNVNFLAKVKKLQNRLRTEVQFEVEGGEERPGLTKVLSLVDAVEAFSNKPIETLPASYLGVGMAGFDKVLPQFRRSLFNADPNDEKKSYYRVMLRSPERSTSAQKRSVIGQVNQICREEFPQAENASRSNFDLPQEVRATGFYVLLTFMIDSVIRDQWTTFGIAAVGIVAVLTVVFFDPRLAVIGLVPNLLPIIMVLGFFGWFGIPLNLGIALIAAVSIGLSIDSSVHYIIAFQRNRKNSSTIESLTCVQDQVGRALVYATLALMLGFLSLCFSDFLPTIYFGATAMIAMFGGLIGNLFLLPLFIRFIYSQS
jgi:predicted RND superfamily exporter protein